ncbi:NADH-quinone oxidoreductase subunit C [Desulfothermobacter acidiphilus]|uniref:NADH-quinone oxidoreductase subunit C n=1 Tax=Desulfothermobacter acidiphilus TaxID=1938353 RepID=UPI003F8AAD0B
MKIINDYQIEKEQLLTEVRRLVAEGARLGATICLDAGEEYEVIYNFQLGLDSLNLRLRVGKEEEVPSISPILLGAVLGENEMREMTGLKVTGMVLDFGDRMLLADESPRHPLLRVVQPGEVKR